MGSSNDSQVRLIVFGRQGAGKGTQASRLAQNHGIPHISTGDMLREAVREGTDFGKRAKEYMDAGQLLPDDVMLGLVSERLSRPDTSKGWLLDGFPRTAGQAEDLQGLVADVLSAEPRYEAAVEAVLGDRLQYVIVNSQDELIVSVAAGAPLLLYAFFELLLGVPLP